MTAPEPIELPERVHGPCRTADVPVGWEWEYATYDPLRIDAWHTYRPHEGFLVWVREPEPVTIEIDADLALRLVNDASLTITSNLATTVSERAHLRAAVHAAKANR